MPRVCFCFYSVFVYVCLGRRLAQGRQKLLRHFRRGSGHNLSFRHNRSFKLMRPDGGGGSECGFLILQMTFNSIMCKPCVKLIFREFVL